MGFYEPKDFGQPIIRILQDSNGKAKLSEIYRQFAAKYPEVVNAPYWNELVDKDLRWKDYINRYRFKILVKQGVLKKKSVKGTWELA